MNIEQVDEYIHEATLALYKPEKNDSKDLLRNSKSPEGIFTIVEQIGSGTYGKVYKANVIHKDQIVAIKTMPVSFQNEDCESDDSSDNDEQSVINEISLMQKLSKHENLVHIYGVYRSGSHIWIAMEFCQTNLSTFMKRRYKNQTADLKHNFIIFTIIEIAKGLNFMHKNNVVHRDIKGQNVLISTEGKIKLADLGIAKAVDEANAKNNIKENYFSTMIGTPHFMAPEVIAVNDGKKGSSKYGFAADIWSLAALITEISTGKPRNL
ncbi:MAG: hypothetical protein MHPSP_000750 [Paramarteilia canceri]